MRKVLRIISVVVALSLMCACSTKKVEDVRYKKEARFFYEQIMSILKYSKADEEVSKIEVVDAQMFSNRIYDAQVSAVCLNELIKTSQYYQKLDNSYKCLQVLFFENEENQEIKYLTDSIYSEYKYVVEILENEDVDLIEENYAEKINGIKELSDNLLAYVKDIEGMTYIEEIDVEDIPMTSNEGVEEISEEVEIVDKDKPGRKDNPLHEGDSIEINFINNEAGRKGDSWYSASGVFTHKGIKDGTIELGFELTYEESGKPIYLDDTFGIDFSYRLVNEALSEDFIEYEGVYKSDDGNPYISVYEGGNVDYCIKLKDNTKYLVIWYVESSEYNLNLKNMYNAETSAIWLEIK